MSGRPGRASGGAQPTHPVLQQGAGEAGHPQREHREHEQLVPEDVSAVGLAVQTSGGDARIEVRGVERHRLQDVERAQPQRAQGVGGDGLGGAVRYPVGEVESEAAPQLAPRQLVADEQVVEPGRVGEQFYCRQRGFGDGHVAGGHERRHLVDRDGYARSHRKLELVPDPAGLLPEPSRCGRGTAHRGRARGHRDTQLGLGGAGHEQDARRVGLAPREHGEVACGQVAVARDAGVGDRPVDAGRDAQRPRPVLGRHDGLQPGQMGIAHVHEAALAHGGVPPDGVDEPECAHEQAAPHVQGQAVLDDLDVGHGEPGTVLDGEAEIQPVRHVDHALGLHGLAADVVAEAVEAARGVGPRIVDAVGPRLRRSATGGETAVAQGEDRLTPAFVGWVPSFDHEGPVVRRHRSRPSGGRAKACRHSTGHSPTLARRTLRPTGPDDPQPLLHDLDLIGDSSARPGRRCRGQDDPECRPAVGWVDGGDGSAVAGDDLADQREADAVPPGSVLPVCTAGREPLEDPWQHRGVDARAVVGDLDGDQCRRSGDRGTDPARGVADRVVDDGGDGPAKPGLRRRGRSRARACGWTAIPSSAAPGRAASSTAVTSSTMSTSASMGARRSATRSRSSRISAR